MHFYPTTSEAAPPASSLNLETEIGDSNGVVFAGYSLVLERKNQLEIVPVDRQKRVAGLLRWD